MGSAVFVWSDRGVFAIGVSTGFPNRDCAENHMRLSAPMPPPQRWSFIVFEWVTQSCLATDGATNAQLNSYGAWFNIPYAIAMTLPLPVLRALSIFRKRARPGCCRHCGYDLRATPARLPRVRRRSRPTARSLVTTFVQSVRWRPARAMRYNRRWGTSTNERGR
jgi:hypothetical protein